MRYIFRTLIFFIAIFTCGVVHAELRIISLKPAITDVFVATGYSNKLVGVTKYCEIPKNLPIVGDYTRPYIEKIIALQPDMVLNSMENSSRKSVERLQSTGIRVELLSFRTTGDMIESIRKIGILTGETKRSEELAKAMRDKLASIKRKWHKAKKERVLIVWGRNPMVVAGSDSYMNEHMDTIGAVNAMADSRIPYPKIGLEELIAIDPDVIIDLSMGSEKDDDSGKLWSGVSVLKAVRKNRVYTMNTGDVRRGPRLPEGLAKLAELIHK